MGQINTHRDPGSAPAPSRKQTDILLYVHTRTRGDTDTQTGQAGKGEELHKENPTIQRHIPKSVPASTRSLPAWAPGSACPWGRVGSAAPRRSQARNSVGRGSDGLVQFEVQAGAAGVEAAVAGFADSAGLKELLAGNGHLLVTATGAEHVATIPCIRNRGEMEKKRSEGV